MGKEFRRITSTNSEMRGALEINAESSGSKLPPGDVVSVKSSRAGSNFIYELGLYDYAKQKEGLLKLPEDQALEVLLNHSIETGIPLPRAARKEVREIEGLMCLDMFLE
jgi:hypothetical protein